MDRIRKEWSTAFFAQSFISGGRGVLDEVPYMCVCVCVCLRFWDKMWNEEEMRGDDLDQMRSDF